MTHGVATGFLVHFHCMLWNHYSYCKKQVAAYITNVGYRHTNSSSNDLANHPKIDSNGDVPISQALHVF